MAVPHHLGGATLGLARADQQVAKPGTVLVAADPDGTTAPATVKTPRETTLIGSGSAPEHPTGRRRSSRPVQ
jgi:hypothetical protein